MPRGTITERRLAWALLLLAAAGCPTGCRGPGSGSPPLPADVTPVEADAGPVYQADLPGLVERGVLRVLVAGADESFLPRQGATAAQDRTLLREFARRHGMTARFLYARDAERLLALLLEGRGDVVATPILVTPGRSEQVRFTEPLATADEVLVGGPRAVAPADGLAGLAGREVHVRAGTAYEETLRALARGQAPGLRVIHVPERLDTEDVVWEVTRGRRPLTVVDTRTLQAIEGYNEDVRRLATVARERQLAWAVRRDDAELARALDHFLFEKALTDRSRDLFTGDLAAIRERGALRVLTRNDPVSYFLHRGRPRGFEYELARLLARDLGVRLEMVVPPSHELLVPWLLEGRGDVIAASLTVTAERAAQVAFSRPYLRVEEVVVQRRDDPAPLRGPEDLAGKRIHVHPGSTHLESLKALRETVGDFELVVVPADVETDQLLADVAEGRIAYAVADSHVVRAELTWRDGLDVAFALPPARPEMDWRDLRAGSKEIAFAVRPDAPALKDAVDRFVTRRYRGLEFNMAMQRYFEDAHRIARDRAERGQVTGRLSRWDPVLRRYAERYGLDWRLMAAVAYQESRFSPHRRSWMGAVGVFQVLPSTASSMGLDPADPEQGIHAGVKYFHHLLSRFDPELPTTQRIRFALAAYNAGFGHVEDARRLAEAQGWDPDRWFGHVERAMLLLEKPAWHRKTRHGYARGSETVAYVAEIQNRYEAYVRAVPRRPREDASP